jgi:hypothetical protein
MDIAQCEAAAGDGNRRMQQQPGLADLRLPAKSVSPSTMYPGTTYLIGSNFMVFNSAALNMMGGSVLRRLGSNFFAPPLLYLFALSCRARTASGPSCCKV